MLIFKLGGFPKGCFSFPFQYQLPHGVPGYIKQLCLTNHTKYHQVYLAYVVKKAMKSRMRQISDTLLVLSCAIHNLDINFR